VQTLRSPTSVGKRQKKMAAENILILMKKRERERREKVGSCFFADTVGSKFQKGFSKKKPRNFVI
jgi:hypothetical protein